MYIIEYRNSYSPNKYTHVVADCQCRYWLHLYGDYVNDSVAMVTITIEIVTMKTVTMETKECLELEWMY